MFELDLYFPYVVLAYGAFMTFVTNMPMLKEKAYGNIDPEVLHWFYGHKILGSVCLFVGALWSMQRLFI